MNDTTTTQLLRDLFAKLTNHPEAIEIGDQPTAGARLWLMKGHPDDEGKLVGKEGSHVNAITFLISAMGMARGETWTFRLITTPGKKNAPPAARKAVISYDPQPLVDLLTRILAELPINDFNVRVGPGRGPRDVLKFEIVIGVRAGVDFQALTTDHTASGHSIHGALTTLYKAIGKNSGVELEVVVAPLSKPSGPAKLAGLQP